MLFQGFWISLALYLLVGTVIWMNWFEEEIFGMLEDEEDSRVQEVVHQVQILVESYGGKAVYLLIAGVGILSWPLYVYTTLIGWVRRLQERG
ncbi:hypothetical protein [Paludifilum halophilum]|nr:hypothetical protein [Paludifilum halophilum]